MEDQAPRSRGDRRSARRWRISFAGATRAMEAEPPDRGAGIRRPNARSGAWEVRASRGPTLTRTCGAGSVRATGCCRDCCATPLTACGFEVREHRHLLDHRSALRRGRAVGGGHCARAVGPDISWRLFSAGRAGPVRRCRSHTGGSPGGGCLQSPPLRRPGRCAVLWRLSG